MTINLRDLAAIVASRTPGYSIDEVEKLLLETEKTICDSLKDGQDVKLHKLVKLSVITQEAHNAYDAVSKKYYWADSKKRLKVSRLILLKEIQSELNETSDGDE